jgi:hypothetical protein
MPLSERFEPFVHGPPFEARWGGQDCADLVGDCDGEIEAGDRIVMVDGEPAHVGCVDHSECPEQSTCA